MNNTIDLNELMHQVTARFTIVGVKRFTLKLRIGLFLAKLGLRIIGMNVVVDQEV